MKIMKEKINIFMKYGLILLCMVLGGIYSCTEKGRQLADNKNIVFVDVTEKASLSYNKNSYAHCWGDVDNNGYPDLYVINHLLAPALFINNGDGTFNETTREDGLFVRGDLHGCAIGDYDNDGDQDIYLTLGADKGSGLGMNRLYRNNGKGEFIDVARNVGVADPKGRGRTASWVDYNNDGYLDLFVANYKRKDAPPVLFKNNGNGSFSDVAIEAGLNIIDSMNESSWIDYDNDGLMDLITLSHRDHRKFEINIYRNTRGGPFEKVKTLYGWTYAFGDYDNDGDMDIFVSVPPRGYIYQRKYTFTPLTKIFRGFSKLYENVGEGRFVEVTAKAGFNGKMGGDKAVFLDYDNDGDLDIYLLVSGTNEKNINDILFENNGDGTFSDITGRIGLLQDFDGRGDGVAVADFNNDGFLDLFLTNGRTREGAAIETEEDVGPYVLYANRGNENHWLKIRLVGIESNRDGIGAQVKLYSGGQLQYRQNNGGMEGFVQHGTPLHFGLGKNAGVERIEVLWPSGNVTEIFDVDPDQYLVIKESTGE